MYRYRHARGAKHVQGLSESIDLTPFKTRQLTQVCFGMWNVAFHFDGPVRVVAEGSIVITNTRGESRRIEDFRECAAQLCAFVGLSVVDASRSPSGGLKLLLSSGTEMEFESINGKYESFQIHFGDRTLVA
jgi:hypothetical protein